MSRPGEHIRLLDGLDDPAVSDADWAGLVAATPAAGVFQTRWWLSAWWQVFGRGRLLPFAVFRNGRPTLIAPLFAEAGMLFPVGAGNSDYLDLVGPPPGTPALARLLAQAIAATPCYLGTRLYHLPQDSPTRALLASVAGTLDQDLVDEGGMIAPFADLRATGTAISERKSLRRHEGWFHRNGALSIRHLSAPEDILPRLDAFFAQHVRRWDAAGIESPFAKEPERRFYRRLAETVPPDRPLLFSEIAFDGAPVAFHFGLRHGESFLWYKPSFDPSWAKRSPGEVLLRSLFRHALETGVATFDFGLGDEAFKSRFATGVRQVRTLGLYPRRHGTGTQAR